jgi:hypothetical protein
MRTGVSPELDHQIRSFNFYLFLFFVVLIEDSKGVPFIYRMAIGVTGLEPATSCFHKRSVAHISMQTKLSYTPTSLESSINILLISRFSHSPILQYRSGVQHSLQEHVRLVHLG